MAFFKWIWENVLKPAGSFAAKYLVKPGVALLVIAIAILLAMLGWKELKIGGILGKLLGRKDPDQGMTVETANSIPPGRIDDKGNLIPLGSSDSKGDTQVQVVKVEGGGLFSDPNVVKVTPPGADKPITVPLPSGVKADDVSHVILISPTVSAVVVKDNTGVSKQTVDDLLKKYAAK